MAENDSKVGVVEYKQAHAQTIQPATNATDQAATHLASKDATSLVSHQIPQFTSMHITMPPWYTAGGLAG